MIDMQSDPKNNRAIWITVGDAVALFVDGRTVAMIAFGHELTYITDGNLDKISFSIIENWKNWARKNYGVKKIQPVEHISQERINDMFAVAMFQEMVRPGKALA